MGVSPNHVALALLGTLLTTGLILTTCSSNWVHSSSVSIDVIGDKTYEQRGLWYFCVTGEISGQTQCTQIMPSAQISKLPAYLGYGRIAMIMSCILITFGTISSILGNPCLKLCRAKSKVITYVTGTLYLLAGILSLIAYSWYTNAAMNNYVKIDGHRAGNLNAVGNISQWDLGWAMWVGFITSILAILGSAHAMWTAASYQEYEDYAAGAEMNAFKTDVTQNYV